MRARRSIQCLYATLSAVTLAAAVFVYHNPAFAGFSVAETSALADALLFLGLANAATMWIWDFLFWNDITS